MLIIYLNFPRLNLDRIQVFLKKSIFGSFCTCQLMDLFVRICTTQRQHSQIYCWINHTSDLLIVYLKVGGKSWKKFLDSTINVVDYLWKFDVLVIIPVRIVGSFTILSINFWTSILCDCLHCVRNILSDIYL